MVGERECWQIRPKNCGTCSEACQTVGFRIGRQQVRLRLINWVTSVKSVWAEIEVVYGTFLFAGESCEQTPPGSRLL